MGALRPLLKGIVNIAEIAGDKAKRMPGDNEGLSSISPELLKVSKRLPSQKAAQKTQIATTTGTYEKAKNV